MKTIITLLFTLSASIIFAQVNFNTGSKELDMNLNIINEDASKDFKSFRKQLSSDFNIDEPKIESMRVSLGLIPGEIYMALEISRNSPSSLDDVLRIYQKNKDKGWGYIAKQAGIKPGSPAFHRLKNNAKGKKDKVKGKPARVKVKHKKKAKGKPHKGRR